jgi:asparagine N-glycosylation enzyme membrane subunit Stt3
MSIFKQSTNFQRQQFDFLVTLVIFLLSLILSFLSIQAYIRKSSIRLKKLTRVLWFMVIAGLLIGLIDFIAHNQIQRFSLIMIPLSFFLTFSYFHKTLSSLAIGLFYITLSYSVIKFFL